MTYSKAAFTGLCLILASLYATAQDCHIALRGYVRDEGSESPLAYATVWVREAGKGASTDENGWFVIPNLCANTNYTIELRHLECEHATQLVRLSENTELCFHMHHNELAEVVIHEKAIAPKATQTEVTVNQADLESARGVNLGETLKKLPGVSLLNTGATIAKPVIQGLHSNRIAIISGNVALESQQWGSEHAPEIDPFTAGKVSVIKGAAGLRYGVGAMAGAVVLEPSPLRAEKGLGGWLSLGGFSNGRGVVSAGAVDWRPGKKSLVMRLQGTYKRSGNLSAPDYFLENTGAQELNGAFTAEWHRARWHHEIGASRFSQKIGILRASHIGNTTDLQRAINSPTPLNNQDEFSYDLARPYQDVAHNTLKYKSVFRLSDTWKLSGQYSFQYNLRREYDVVRSSGAAATKPQVTFQLYSSTLDAALEHFPIRHWQGGTGIQVVQQTNFVSRGGFIPDYQAVGGGVWLAERWRKYPNPWEFELGLRYDYRQTAATTTGNLVNLDTLVHFGNISGSAGAIYHLTSAWSLALNTGQAWRPPHVNELFAKGVHHGAGTYEEGNPNLLPEKAWNTNLTLQYDKGGWWLQAAIYRNQIRDFIYLNPGLNTVLTVRGAFPAYYYQQTSKAVLQGADINWRAPIWKGISADGALSMLRGRRIVDADTTEITRDWLPLMPADRFRYGLRWEKPVRDNAFEAAVSATTALRQTRIPAEGLLKAAPDGFTILTLDLMWRQSLRKGRKLNVGLSINNLTQTRYREYLNFFRYFADEPGLNAGLRAKMDF